MNEPTLFKNAATPAQRESRTPRPAPATCSEVRVALSIRQPWAWLIVNGHKDIENRTWPTRFKGRVLIHAGATMTRGDYEACVLFIAAFQTSWRLPALDIMKRTCGGIVGEAEIIGCVTQSESPWFVGEYGFVIRNAKPLPFRRCKGALGFFKPPKACGVCSYPIGDNDTSCEHCGATDFET